MITWILPITYTGIALVQMTALLAVSTHQTSLSPLENAPQRQLGAIPAVLEELENDTYLKGKLAELRKCESGNNDSAINHFDGLTHSYGRYQWKIESIAYYNTKYKLLPDIEEHEIENIIYDPWVQDSFTYLVIRDGGWRNWLICGKRIGLNTTSTKN